MAAEVDAIGKLARMGFLGVTSDLGLTALQWAVAAKDGAEQVAVVPLVPSNLDTLELAIHG